MTPYPLSLLFLFSCVYLGDGLLLMLQLFVEIYHRWLLNIFLSLLSLAVSLLLVFWLGAVTILLVLAVTLSPESLFEVS